MPKEFDEKKIKDNNGFQFSTRVQASFDLEKAQGKYYTVQKTFKDYCILEILSYISYIRNEEKQEALWKYSIDCLREFLKPDDLKRERTTVAESHIYQHDCHCHE